MPQQSDLSKYIPAPDMGRLIEFYDGKKCIIKLEDQTRASVEWAHLIPHLSVARGTALDKLKSLNLCHKDSTPTSSENMIPLERGFHGLFDEMRWGLFPTIDVLHNCIYTEELWWHYRELVYETKKKDVGRPPFVGGSMDGSMFEAHWPDPPPTITRQSTDGAVMLTPATFPLLRLIAGVPNVIIACIPRLANIFPKTPHTRNVLVLGLYLEMLWNRKLNEAAPRRPIILPNWEYDPVILHQAPPFPTTASQGQNDPLPSRAGTPRQQDIVSKSRTSQVVETGFASYTSIPALTSRNSSTSSESSIILDNQDAEHSTGDAARDTSVSNTIVSDFPKEKRIKDWLELQRQVKADIPELVDVQWEADEAYSEPQCGMTDMRVKALRYWMGQTPASVFLPATEAQSAS